MIVVGSEQRIATVRRTGERYLVQQVNLDRNLVFCWAHLTGTGYGPKKEQVQLEGSVSFPRGDVHLETVRLTTGIALDLFEQYRLARRDDLMSGAFMVVKQGNSARIRKSPATALQHEVKCCPRHSGIKLRLRRGRNGVGFFFGCATRGETGCNIAWSPDSDTWSDPDGYFAKE